MIKMTFLPDIYRIIPINICSVFFAKTLGIGYPLLLIITRDLTVELPSWQLLEVRNSEHNHEELKAPIHMTPHIHDTGYKEGHSGTVSDQRKA